MNVGSMSSVHRPTRAPAIRQRQFARAVLWCAAGLILALACVLLLRRLAGAFQQPLSAGSLIVAGLTMAGLAGAMRGAWRWLEKQHRAGEFRRIDAFEWLPMLAAVLLGVAVSCPASPTWALVVFWFTVCGGELAYWCPRACLRRRGSTRESFSPGDGGRETRLAGDAPQVSAPPIAEHKSALLEEVEDDEGELEILPPDVFQRITRAKAGDGSAVVYGLVRCEFAADQRQQNVHVAFCPPLTQKPHLHADQILGPKVTLKPSLVETFGACLDVRLVAPNSEPAVVQIQFYAAENSPHASAG